MAQFFTLPTEIGQAKIANAIALNEPIEITELAVGDGGGSLPTPQGDEEQLINEVRRAAINTSDVDDDNPSWIVVEQVIPPDVGGWTIREVGIYDSAGDLIGYGNYPETYKPVLEEGTSRTQTVRFVLEVSDTAAVTLKVDPSVVLATREYVDDGDAALKDEIEQSIADAGYQFANYDPDRTYSTGEVVRGSDGVFYEFYDRDQVGTVQGVAPTDSANRPHIWMEWDGTRPGATIEWRSETVPEGYIENDGAEISRSDYRRVFAVFGETYGAGDGSTTFLLPDDRGEFKRGWDHGRGVDTGRSFASHQWHAVERHVHAMPTGAASGEGHWGVTDSYWAQTDAAPGSVNNAPETGDTAGTYHDDRGQGSPTGTTWIAGNYADETRPRNNAVIYLTKI